LKLIVGLGNPGFKYKPTRHNLGFMVVDGLSQELGIDLYQLKHESLIGRGEWADESLTLAKPMTYMNLSGQAVRALVRGLGLSLTDIIIICDDLNLPLGTLRIRGKGGAGGHKGLGSIINALESEQFTRLRLGIDRPPPNMDAADYVLQPFARHEWPTVQQMVSRAKDALCTLIRQGLEPAMNRFNPPSNKESTC
jgi:PTH1 family peptidyl-tRNA hydrolase